MPLTKPLPRVLELAASTKSPMSPSPLTFHPRPAPEPAPGPHQARVTRASSTWSSHQRRCRWAGSVPGRAATRGGGRRPSPASKAPASSGGPSPRATSTRASASVESKVAQPSASRLSGGLFQAAPMAAPSGQLPLCGMSTPVWSSIELYWPRVLLPHRRAAELLAGVRACCGRTGTRAPAPSPHHSLLTTHH